MRKGVTKSLQKVEIHVLFLASPKILAITAKVLQEI